MNDNGELVIDLDDVSGMTMNITTNITLSIPLTEMTKIVAGYFDIGSPLDEPLRSTDESPQINVCVEAIRLAQHELPLTSTMPMLTKQASHFLTTVDSGAIPGPSSMLARTMRWPAPSGCLNKPIKIIGYPLAEWEYAARAGATTLFHTEQTITSEQANFQAIQPFNGSQPEIFRQPTVPVGSFSPNAFGLFDMHGNVQERTCCTFIGNYRSESAPQTCEYGIRTWHTSLATTADVSQDAEARVLSYAKFARQIVII